MKFVTHYFPVEGRACMNDCLQIAVDWCAKEQMEHLVIFTGTGDGPLYAANELLVSAPYRHLHLQIVAVTPPFGRPYRENPTEDTSRLVHAGIPPAMRSELEALGVTVLAAHLPFKEVYDGRERTSPWTRVAEAYGVLGGGFALGVQALLIACDAGAVPSGTRVVVATADTAFVAMASRTETFLSPYEGVLVEHLLCRPMRYSISKAKHHHVDGMWGERLAEPPKQLPLPKTDEPEAEVLALPPAPSPDVDEAEKPRKRTKTKRPKG